MILCNAHENSKKNNSNFNRYNWLRCCTVYDFLVCIIFFFVLFAPLETICLVVLIVFVSFSSLLSTKCVVILCSLRQWFNFFTYFIWLNLSSARAEESNHGCRFCGGTWVDCTFPVWKKINCLFFRRFYRPLIIRRKLRKTVEWNALKLLQFTFHPKKNVWYWCVRSSAKNVRAIVTNGTVKLNENLSKPPSSSDPKEVYRCCNCCLRRCLLLLPGAATCEFNTYTIANEIQFVHDWYTAWCSCSVVRRRRRQTLTMTMFDIQAVFIVIMEKVDLCPPHNPIASLFRFVSFKHGRSDVFIAWRVTICWP